jgi:hypothetical protein
MREHEAKEGAENLVPDNTRKEFKNEWSASSYDGTHTVLMQIQLFNEKVSMKIT